MVQCDVRSNGAIMLHYLGRKVRLDCVNGNVWRSTKETCKVWFFTTSLSTPLSLQADQPSLSTSTSPSHPFPFPVVQISFPSHPPYKSYFFGRKVCRASKLCSPDPGPLVEQVGEGVHSLLLLGLVIGVGLRAGAGVSCIGLSPRRMLGNSCGPGAQAACILDSPMNCSPGILGCK